MFFKVDERAYILYFYASYLIVVSSFNNFVSPITLALCEDSGWYKANYTMSEVSFYIQIVLLFLCFYLILKNRSVHGDMELVVNLLRNLAS